MGQAPLHGNKSWMQLQVKDRYPLSRPGSGKRVYHVVLQAKDPVSYRAGDCLAIQPKNDPGHVAAICEYLGFSKDALVEGNTTAQELLLTRYNLSRVSRKLVELLVQGHREPSKRRWLSALLEPGHEQSLARYLADKEVWDLLSEHREARVDFHAFCQQLSPLLPRFYSIASSPKVTADEIHLTVGLVAYEEGGVARRGVCSHYLCHLAPLGDLTVASYLHPTEHFLLPEDGKTPVIMIGPGTGVAPFRAFMQERVASGATGGNWLFFGDRQRAYDFVYEADWSPLVEQGHLRLDLAFSRDQEHKVYVQDKMREHGGELWRWLQEGAHLYVCGDARQMAKGVDKTLSEIAIAHGGLSLETAQSYFKELRAQKRYLRDVY